MATVCVSVRATCRFQQSFTSLHFTLSYFQSLQKNSRFNRVGVYCGASTGRRPAYADLARALGRELVATCARNIGLVYGGGDVGLSTSLALQ